jgi:glucuronate isomerase
MFTTEPPLAQRIERLIGKTPIVDVYSQIRVSEPTAPDLASLISNPEVVVELRSVGMSSNDLEPSLPADELVRRAIPYLSRMRNTSTAWCLFRIFRDLYDFHDPHLTESNSGALFDKVAASGRDPEWANSVLVARSNIRAVVTSIDNGPNEVAGTSHFYHYRFDGHDLFASGVSASRFRESGGLPRKSQYYERLCSRFAGERPSTTESLRKRLRDWLDATITNRVSCFSVLLPVEYRFGLSDESHVELILGQADDDWDITESDVDVLVRFVTWEVLGWHDDHRKTIQLAVGDAFLQGADRAVPRFQDTWVSDMAQVFERFHGCRFDLLMASDRLTQEVAALTRQFPNVYASGYWRHNMSPSVIEKILSVRVQMSPMTKFSGFLSDSRFAEWTYGRLQLVKKAMAQSLSRLVEAGYYEEDELPSLLHQILHDTPRDLYQLDVG